MKTNRLGHLQRCRPHVLTTRSTGHPARTEAFPRRSRPAVALGLAGLLLLAGCASPPTPSVAGPAEPSPAPVAVETVASPPPAPAPPDDRELQARRDLAAAVARYEAGQYGEAIRLLQTSPGIWASSSETRAAAFKILAFSHCVSNRPKACRDAFDALLRVDPTFDLTAAEAGHPQWGQVFLAAKVASLRLSAGR